MLKRVQLENFKLHASTTIEAAPITVFIGPNNSGKSSVFQALLALRQAFSEAGRGSSLLLQSHGDSLQQHAPYLFDERQLIDIGGFEDILRAGQHEVMFGISGSIGIPHEHVSRGDIQVSFECRLRSNSLQSHTGTLDSDLGHVSWKWSRATQEKTVTSDMRVRDLPVTFSPTDNFQMLQVSNIVWPKLPLPQHETTDIHELAQFIARTPASLMHTLHPVFPLRGLEASGYPLPDYSPRNLDRLVLADRTLALLARLAYDRDLEEKLANWMQDLIGVRIRIKLIPPKRVTMLCSRTKGSFADSLFSNEGTGTNQLPFILAPIGLTPAGETILLSEPEAHLHPKAQADLLSHILTLFERERRQFFIETHSEHVLHSLLHAVAAGRVNKDHLAIYYFERKNGVAETRRLEVDKKGRVPGGLPGFFEHSIAELAEYLDALKHA
ncbi:MAG: DUF3696 domain-containing protein [Candidatus Acidiferrales bacterium]